MPDTPEKTNAIEVIAEALEGGLLRLIASKPIQQAVGRLVSGAVDIPAAYLERWAQRIRSDTLAEKQITSTIAAEAKLLASTDQELIERGIDRWTRKFGARQRSIDDVGLRTIAVLGEGGDLPPDAAAPAEDFMRMFEDIAERASSDAVADLLARILAGEIRKPHSVSLKTLQTVAIIDRSIIESLQMVASNLLDGGWIHVPDSKRREWYRKLFLLSSVSILNEVGVRTIRLDATGRNGIVVQRKIIMLNCKPALTGVWHVTGTNLTMIGEELISLLPVSKQVDINEIARGFSELSFVNSVQVGDVTLDENGNPSSYNLVEISGATAA